MHPIISKENSIVKFLNNSTDTIHKHHILVLLGYIKKMTKKHKNFAIINLNANRYKN